MIIRRRFRPLGKLLQRFGRGQINNYTHTTNMASRAEVPPVWEDDAQQPLVWSDPDVAHAVADNPASEVAPAVQRRSRVQRKTETAPAPSSPSAAPATSAAPGDTGERRTPPDLWKIHDMHTQMLEEEGYRMPPSPWAKPVDPNVSRLPAPPPSVDKPVQRRTQNMPAPETSPSRSGTPVTPAPPTISSRRRGRVIEETPQQQEMGEAAASMPDDEPPNWETELETGEDRPDLFEALMSEGVVQRRHSPDLSDSETFAPTIRHAPQEPPANRRETPASSPAAPNVQRSEASQPPRTERSVRTPPETPPVVQGSTSPAQVQRDSDPENDYYAADDADMPPSLVPAPGTTEADLLDMLGLPQDTPVRGLNPAAAMPPASSESPSTPSNGPAAPVQRQSTPPPGQGSETTPPANPAPRPSQRTNVPPTSPYRSQTTGEQQGAADTPSSAQTSLSNPTVMRQPEMPDAQDEAPDDSDAEDWSEPPAVSSFTSFFEAAETVLTGSSRPGNPPVQSNVSEWSEPSETQAEPGESLPRGNPFPAASDAQSVPASSAPTRPTPRVQRTSAEPDLPYTNDDESESFGDFEDTQPIDLPFTSSTTPTPEAGSRPSVQRASMPAPEAPDESYPHAADPAFFEADAPAESSEFRSEPQDVESFSPESDSESSQAITPRASRPVSSSPAQPVQRAESPSAPAQPGQPQNPGSAPVGYHIEGLPESRGTAPTGQVSRAKTGDTTSGDKLGGKTVPQGMSMSLPSKTTTDSISSGVTAPSSGSSPSGGSKGGDPNMGGKTGGGPSAIGGKTDPGSAPPQNTTSDWSTSTLPVDEAVSDSSSSSSSSSDPSSESGEASPNEQSGGQNDVDKLARDVYNLLRDRLRVEQERRPKR